MSLVLLSGLLSAASLYAQHGRIVWTEPIRLPTGLAGVLAGVDHGVLLVGGGCNFPDSMPWAGGKKQYYKEVYAVDLTTRKVIAVDSLPAPAAYGASVSTSRGVVYIGGENARGSSTAVLCLSWDVVTRLVDVRRWPDLPVALTNACAAVVGETVYVAGGETAGGVSGGLYALDLSGSAWRQAGVLPKALSHAVLIAAGHRLYLVGGRHRNPGGVSDLSDGVYCYDAVAGRWSQCRSLPYALSAGTGILYDEHSLLMLGGDRGEVFHEVEKLIAAADGASDLAKRQELLLRKARVQASHPGFSREVLRYDMRRDAWSKFDVLPFPSPATTTAVRWENCIVIPGGETRAGVRTSQILIGVISR